MWTEDQIDVAEALASQASVALENARLYDKARRAYRELNEAQARIIQSEKMAVVGTFASGLAHEVRNPLNSIALQLSILERRVNPLPAGVAGEIKELVGVIREEVKRLDNLVGDFLQFSRSNRVQFRPTNLDVVVDEVMRLLRPEARASGVTLRRQRIGDPMPDLRVDPEKMKQVAINLVQNGIEAMPGGGVVYGRERAGGRASGAGRPRQRARPSRRARRVPAVRHDEGPGHRPRPQHRAADRARARRRDRRLEPARRRRDLHGHPAGGAARRGRGRRSMSVKGRLVVIDDEVNAAAALETLLKEDGYEVARAHDARSGLSLLEKTEPDVVLTDLRMPGMDGIELLAKIKEIRPETMVILTTAYGTVKTAVKAMKLVAEDNLSKPIDVEEL